MHRLCYNWSALWNCNEKNQFIATPVSISGVEGSATWTDTDGAPIPISAEEFHLMTGLTGEGHLLFRPTAHVCSKSHTQLNNRFQHTQLSTLSPSLFLCLSHISKHYQISITVSCGLQNKISVCIWIENSNTSLLLFTCFSQSPARCWHNDAIKMTVTYCHILQYTPL